MYVFGVGVVMSQNLGLAAEHGLHFRFPGELKMSGDHLNFKMDMSGTTPDLERYV